MPVRVYINGKVFPPEEAVISVFDRGFLFGDSVYETMRTYEGRPVDMDAHLDRLGRSASALGLNLPAREELLSAVEQTLRDAGNPESNVRVVVTRGPAEKVGLATDLAGAPTHIVIVRELVLPPAELYEKGAALAVVGVQRTSKRAVDPKIKSGNYLNNIMALSEARKSGAHEAIMLDAKGLVTEGSTSNVFVVRGGAVVTPALDVGLLDGITRTRVIELCKGDGIAVSEGELTPEDLFGADEVFITSSVRGVLPISDVSGHRPAAGAPGPVTQAISKLYAAYLASA